MDIYMRVLHTADLHLGRQFNGIPLDDDQAAILDQILRAIIDRLADVLVIAGDIFDRAVPSETAVRQFNAFLSRVALETDAAVVIIAGNHDSAHRIAAMAIMPDRRRLLIRGAAAFEEIPLLLSDSDGVVAFSGLPFAYEYAARECFSDEGILTPEDVLKAQVAAARRNIPEGARWVVVAHAFVAGAMGSDSERPLARVGGIETVSPEVFEGAHYVALGHLHRPQAVGSDHIRYSGSPLAFGFDEAGSTKTMTLVEIDASGAVAVEAIPFTPLRDARVLRGKHAELLLAEPSTDFIKAILSDDAPVIDGMRRLRAVFPNACELMYERDQRSPELKSLEGRTSAATKPIDVVGEFLVLVAGENMTDDEKNVITATLHALQCGEGAA
jgi:DNA repair protein SbcD/Mre11